MEYHKLLLRQLKHCALSKETLPQSMVEWQDFLQRVSNAYTEADSDRYTLERSQEISSQETQTLNEQLIKSARFTGMAEIAANMLHNIGNVLNSVNVSVDLIKEKINKLINIDFNKSVTLIKQHTHDFEHFITQDPQGIVLMQYLNKIDGAWHKSLDSIANELNLLNINTSHINNIISTQLSLSGASTALVPVQIAELLNEIIEDSITGYAKKMIKVKCDSSNISPVLTDKMKLQQILMNLIINAKDSLLNSKNNNKEIILRTRLIDNLLVIEVIDNGQGISEDKLKRIFSFGYTTKPNRSGLGLHSSALLAYELEGTLQAYSDGLEKGAKFVLEIPYNPLESAKAE